MNILQLVEMMGGGKNMISNFLSNKYNLFGLMVACYVFIGTILTHHLSAPQVIVIIVAIAVSNMLWYIWGVGRGMVIAAISSSKGWDKVLDKIKKDGKKK